MTTVADLARAARDVCPQLAVMPRAAKDAVLLAMAEAVVAGAAEVLSANAEDVADLRASGANEALIDRLALTTARIEGMAGGLRQVAGLPDPVGEVVRGSRLPSGLDMRQVRVPFGVVAIVYEARPNVTVDAAGLCFKSGNAVLLRGSSSAARSNAALIGILRKVLADNGIAEAAITMVPADDRESVTELLKLRGLVDVAIPRGGAGLIRTVVETATVPVIETGVGNCHVYVDASADLDAAERIILNAKVQRPSVCNAAETLLVHRDVAAEFLPRALAALAAAGVTMHGDAAVVAFDATVVPATDVDWSDEYLSLDLAVAVVDDLDAAVEHIRRWGSGHTEAIVTRDQDAARRFVAAVDSAAVMVNASTRFTDGEEFGFGAEIGISTQKMHARGPMGLPELTSTKYIVTGDGHIR